MKTIMLTLVLTVGFSAKADAVNNKYRYELWCTGSVAKIQASKKGSADWQKFIPQATKDCKASVATVPDSQWENMATAAQSGCQDPIVLAAPKGTPENVILSTIRQACVGARQEDQRHQTGNAAVQMARIVGQN